MSAALILIVLAFLFAVFAAFNLLPHPRVQWGWLGLACWFASLLVGQARLL